jgi:general secretion pathway protein D
MRFFNQLTAALLTAALLVPAVPLGAKTRKGDRYLAEGRVHEGKKEWDQALADYEKALSEDPADLVYQMAAQKARFQTSQVHIAAGLKLRTAGQIGEALLEFQKAYGINPSSAAAQQEIARTGQMIERERKRVETTGREAPPEERGMTPVETMKSQEQGKIERMLPAPELKPLNPQKVDLKMNGQKSRVIFDTLGKVAGLNVIWDPEFQPPPRDSFTIEFGDSTINQALDYAAILTRSFWKPLSPNTIFITNDNPNKRRDYEEQIAQVFYLNNVSTPQEIQEIVNAVRGMADLQRVFPYNSQNAIVVRAEADKVALAGKIIRDLDKPKPEVVVDILVIEASSQFTRQITAALASTGLSLPFTFSPRTSIQVQGSSSSTSTSTTGTTTSSTTTGTTTSSSTTGTEIPLSNLGHLASADFATTLPSALLQATMDDTRSKVLQSPQVRSVDNIKATLKIGDRQPTATGSYSSTVSAVSPLVNTQFTYIDVGVNVDLTPHVHDNGDVSMHVDIEISSVNGHVDLGGISQPIIGQRKITHDIRMHEGEVGLLGGLIKTQDNNTVTGIPGLAGIPILGHLFKGTSVERDRDELMIALIPHIIRRQDVTPNNLKGVAVGNQTTIHLNYAPQAEAIPAPATGPKAAPAGQPAAPPVTAPPAAPAAIPATIPAGPANAPAPLMPPATAPPLLPAGGAAPGPPPGPGARVNFNQPRIDTSLSSTFDVVLNIENGADVASAPFEIRFDPKILRLNDVIPGDYFTRAIPPPVFTKNLQNDTGTAAIQLGRPPGSPGVAGAGTLVMLSFQAIGRGTATVSVPNLTVRNSQGQTVATASPQVAVNVK